MRRIMLCGVLVAATSVAMAQTTLDDFESYADDAALQVEWVGASGVTPTLGLAGGASGSTKWMKVVDVDSYAGSVTAADLGTPAAAGNFKVTFFYKNGDSSDPAMQPAQGLKLFVKQGGNNLASFDIPDTLQETWTAAETPVFAGTASPVEIFISKNNPVAPVLPITGESFAFDQIVLVPVAVVPLTIDLFPGAAIRIGNTHTLAATVAGGSGSYTKVDFDVNNDSTIDFTDNSAPFEFALDTRAYVPTGQGTLTVKAIVTDSAMATAEKTVTYNVDNRWGGRESLVTNNGFDTWAGGIPAGWEAHQVGAGTGAAVVAEEPTSHNASAGKSMKITFAASDYNNRYTMRTVGRQGNWVDLQTWYWGRGGANRIYYGRSTDGVTYINTLTDAAQVNNASWTFAQGTVKNLGTPLGDTEYVCVMTHNFNAGDVFFDDVFAYGTKDTSSSVDDWKLF